MITANPLTTFYNVDCYSAESRRFEYMARVRGVYSVMQAISIAIKRAPGLTRDDFRVSPSTDQTAPADLRALVD